MSDRTDQVLQILEDFVAVLRAALERPEILPPVASKVHVDERKPEPEKSIDVAPVSGLREKSKEKKSKEKKSKEKKSKEKPGRRIGARSVPVTTALQFLMDKSGLSCEDVAKDLGISVYSLRFYLQGETPCDSPGMQRRIAELFDVPVSAVWDESCRAKLLTPAIDNSPSLPDIRKMSLEEFAKRVAEGAYTEKHSYARQFEMHKEHKALAHGTNIPRPVAAGKGLTTVLSRLRSEKSLSLRFFGGLVKSQTNLPTSCYAQVEKGEYKVESTEARKVIASMLDVEDYRTLFSTDGRAIKCPMP